MKTTRELQDEINRIKKEKNICILVHAYQGHDIWEVADYVGDSYGLSVKAADSDADIVIMCGVRFMGETVKTLAPDKTVYISHPDADCPMARQMDREYVLKLKEDYPDYAVAAYVNTTAEMKTACDVCVTSASAVKIIKNYPNDKIIFLPDCNLGQWVKNQVPDKDIKLFKGGCPVHYRISISDVNDTKEKHPNALVLVHPECRPEVTEMSDYAGSTTGIMEYAKNSDAKEFIIGTENSIVQHLKYQCPDKKFYELSKKCICENMKLTTLADIYDIVTGKSGEEILLSEAVINDSRKCLDKMIELG